MVYDTLEPPTHNSFFWKIRCKICKRLTGYESLLCVWCFRTRIAKPFEKDLVRKRNFLNQLIALRVYDEG
jgi:hypothetical protein